LCTTGQKSKRDCEGYNQRLTFKEPLGTPFHHGPLFGGSRVYQHPAHEVLVNTQVPIPQPRLSSAQGPLLPIIAPRPPALSHGTGIPLPYEHGYPRAAGSSAADLTISPPFYSPQHVAAPNREFPSPAGLVPSPLGQTAFDHADAPDAWSPLRAHEASRAAEALSFELDNARASMSRAHGGLVSPIEDDMGLRRVASSEDHYWHSDDEASMDESDDDEDMYEETNDAHLASNDLGILVVKRLGNLTNRYNALTHMRDFSGSVDMNWLQTYTPSSTNSPLNDKQTAIVFWYFVNVTGPSMSLYERHPHDPGPMFEGQPVPKAQQHIWMCKEISIYGPRKPRPGLVVGSRVPLLTPL
jgi:hypothetical protein